MANLSDISKQSAFTKHVMLGAVLFTAMSLIMLLPLSVRAQGLVGMEHDHCIKAIAGCDECTGRNAARKMLVVDLTTMLSVLGCSVYARRSASAAYLHCRKLSKRNLCGHPALLILVPFFVYGSGVLIVNQTAYFQADDLEGILRLTRYSIQDALPYDPHS